MPISSKEKTEFDSKVKQQTPNEHQENLIVTLNRDAISIIEKELCSEEVLKKLISLIKDQEIRERVLSNINYNNQKITEEQVDKLEKRYTNSKILNF